MVDALICAYVPHVHIPTSPSEEKRAHHRRHLYTTHSTSMFPPLAARHIHHMQNSEEREKTDSIGTTGGINIDVIASLPLLTSA